MALLKTNEVVRRELPHEPGAWFEFSVLTGRDLQRAREATMSRLIRTLGIEAVAALENSQEASSQSGVVNGTAAPPAVPAPGAGLDIDAVLESAIRGWSYEEPVTPENVGLLDDTTRSWAFGEVVALSARPTAPSSNGAGS